MITISTVDLTHTGRWLWLHALHFSSLATAGLQWLRRHTWPPAEPPITDAAREAAAVRALADSYRKTDPGFASDLFAAADRHEITQAEAGLTQR